MSSEKSDDLCLTVHIRLETGDGTRIAEVRLNECYENMFGDWQFEKTESVIAGIMARQVIAPIRCKTRAHLAKLREARRPAFARLDHPRKELAWEDPQDENFDAIIAEIYRDRVLEETA